MPNSELIPSSYQRLVSDIVSFYEGARKALVGAYWKIGQRIVRVEQKGEIKASYGAGLLQKLSGDLAKRCGLGFSESNLRRMRQFYLAHPIQPPAVELTWTQYAELLPLENAAQRERLIQKAVREELDSKAVRELVRRERVREQVAKNLATPPEKREPVELLKVPKLGPFYTYQIRAAEDVSWPEKGVLLLDRGFRSYCPLTARESRGLKAGDIVEWTGAKLKKTPYSVRRTPNVLYTYKAYLRKLIDGDTLWVVLDAGVRNVMREKLRLRGIDCPEIDTDEGKAAKKFVEDLLRDVPSLTILSSQNATYDRFEADIFFTDQEGNEQYLNNLLLESGYAVKVRS